MIVNVPADQFGIHFLDVRKGAVAEADDIGVAVVLVCGEEMHWGPALRTTTDTHPARRELAPAQVGEMQVGNIQVGNKRSDLEVRSSLQMLTRTSATATSAN